MGVRYFAMVEFRGIVGASLFQVSRVCENAVGVQRFRDGIVDFFYIFQYRQTRKTSREAKG